MDKDTKDILATVTFIKEKVEQLPTEERVQDIVRAMLVEVVPGMVAVEVKPLREELASLRREVEELGRKVDNVIQFRKEIDHALERIAAIEKHLGINRKIAA
jgi:hypothetical protein